MLSRLRPLKQSQAVLIACVRPSLRQHHSAPSSRIIIQSIHQSVRPSLNNSFSQSKRCFATDSKKDSKKDSKQEKQQEQEEEPLDEGDAPVSSSLFTLRNFGILASVSLLAGVAYHYHGKGAALHAAAGDREWQWYHIFTDVYDGAKDSIETSLGLSRTPLLPPPRLDQAGRKPRTLVIAVEDVITHLDWDRYNSYQLKTRPDWHMFLREAFKLRYEIVLFSRKPSYEVEPILMSIDPDGMAPNRLFFEQMNFKGMRLIKDMSRLNRELERVLVIDFNSSLYEGHEDNVILVKQFTDEKEHDTEFRSLIPVLRKIQEYNVYDVRPIIAKRASNPPDNKNEGLFVEEERLAADARKELALRRSGGSRRRKTAEIEQVEQKEQSPAVSGGLWSKIRSRIGL